MNNLTNNPEIVKFIEQYGQAVHDTRSIETFTMHKFWDNYCLGKKIDGQYDGSQSHYLCTHCGLEVETQRALVEHAYEALGIIEGEPILTEYERMPICPFLHIHAKGCDGESICPPHFRNDCPVIGSGGATE